ncbi:T9SS C-terminal target domain-containing protein [bacterium]|nr:MAG: T9SS C-terminal target domain-containing protein [bacterium]
MFRSLFRSLFVVTLCSWSVLAQTVYFTDAGSDTVKLGNTSFYEVGFRKNNGGMAYIIDKSTGRSVTLGSRYQELWGAMFRNPSAIYKGAGSYSPSGQDRFSYNWNASTGILTMQYTPSASAQRKFAVTVEVIASASNYFDLRAKFVNGWGDTISTFNFPQHLVLKKSDINEGLISALPGVILKSSFFTQSRSYYWNYPGLVGYFSDFVSFSLQSGRFAMYAVYDTAATPYVNYSLWPDDQFAPGSTILGHDYVMYLSSGKSWTTPRTRIRVGADHPSAIGALRIDSGIDQLASIQDKYGSYYDRVIKAPLIKCGFLQLQTNKRSKFADFDTLIATLPVPSILHPVGFEVNGFARSYPDVLPPDTSLGTTAEYQTFYRRTQSRGIMIMPYTEVLWWTDKSPTILNLSSSGLSVKDIAAITENLQPRYDGFMNGTTWLAGYVVSPRHPFVRDRLSRLVTQLTSDLPSDILFQDEIGARPGVIDLNPTSPTPFSFIDGWIEHCQLYKQKRLATERGFDRLIDTHVSFHGSARLDELHNQTDSYWGKGNWDYYPLVPMLAGDKVLLYQHDLSSTEALTSKDNLRWDLTFGFMHTYDLADGRFRNPEWLNVAGDFQSHVANRYAGKRMKQYTTIQTRLTRSVFEGISVTSNWDTTASVTLDAHTLPPGGVLAQADDGSLTAGIFSVYNSQALTPSPPYDHYIIVERSARGDSLNVIHWLGGDTPLHLERPTFWPASAVVRVFAVAKAAIIEVSKTITTSAIDFTLAKSVQGQVVLRYVVTSTAVAASVPTLTSPPDSSTNVPSSTTLTWGSAIGAVSYHLQLSTTSAFTSTIVNDSSLAATSKAVGSLSLSTTYYWRVRAKNSNGTSAWSTVRSFTTIVAAPQSPILASPPDGGINQPLSITLSWNPSAGATSYHIQLSASSSFASMIVNDSTLQTTSRTVGALSLATTCYWRVRAKNSGGYSTFSPTRQFSTIRTTSVEQVSGEIPKDYGLGQNYPNPFNPATTIRFALPKACQVTLKVFDLLGREIALLVSENKAAGYYQVRWNANVPSGIYFYRLEAGEFTESKKLMLVK